MNATQLFPPTVYDRPQPWSLLPDPKGPRDYANVTNVLEIVWPSGTTVSVCVAVPSEVFTFMREVAKASPTSRGSLSIDVDRTGASLFSLLIEEGGGGQLYDLWRWPQGRIPEWMLDKQYQTVRR